MQTSETAVRASFSRQTLMAAIGAELASVAPGEVEVALAFRPDLGQQHGFLHAAAVTAIADTACGYAALTLMPEGSEVMSVESKVNLLAPPPASASWRRRAFSAPARLSASAWPRCSETAS